MHLATQLALLGLAMTTTAAPVGQKRNEAITSGTNGNGSLYAFDPAAKCHQTFRQYGACGIGTYFKDIDPNMSLVAIPSEIFAKYGASQNNKLCGKTITMQLNGVTKTAVVADQNISNDHSVDMCMDLWTAFGGRENDPTVIHGFTWSIG